MNKNEEDELLEKLAKEMMKNGGITSAFDVEEKLRKSFGKIIQSMLEEEMNEHLGREKYEHERTKEADKVSDNYRNGHSRKKVKSNLGEVELNIPRDRNGEFEPVVVPKHSRDISKLETQIIELYGMGNTTREISNFVENPYEYILRQQKKWKKR